MVSGTQNKKTDMVKNEVEENSEKWVFLVSFLFVHLSKQNKIDYCVKTLYTMKKKGFTIIFMRGVYMSNYTNINSFIFDKVTYSDYHHGNLSYGVRHNCIMHLKKGEAEIVSENSTLRLLEGEIALIPKGTKYNTYLYGSPEIEFYSYAFLNYPGTIIKSFAPQKIETTPKIAELSEKLIDCEASGCRTLGIFFLLLDELLKGVKTSHSDKQQQMLENAMNYMITHPDCKVSDVAKHCNISEPSLYLLFQKTGDTTPAKFKMKVKLERALNYILTTDLSMEEISTLCHFSSPSYFRKNFCKAYQKTPSEMRKSNVMDSIL